MTKQRLRSEPQWESRWMKRDGVEWNWSDRTVNEVYRFHSNYIVYRSRLFNASELSWIHLHSQHAFMALLLLLWASMNMLVNMWIPLTFYSLVLCCGLQWIWLFCARPLSKSINFSSTCWALLARSWCCISVQVLLHLGSTRCQGRMTYKQNPTTNMAEHECTHGWPRSIPMGILLFATSTWILEGSVIWVTHTHGSITHRCMGTHGLFL